MTRDELINSREYWITKIQLDLFAQIEQYMATNKLSRTQLAEQLGVTKGYISQILNGDFDHKISKLVDLSLAIGKAPDVRLVDLNEFTSKNVPATIVSHYPFKAMIRGGQLQDLSYSDDVREPSADSKIQTA